MIVVLAEKSSVGIQIAATLGGCFINEYELNSNMISNKKFEKMIKMQCNKDGYLKCKYNNKDCIVTWAKGHLGMLKDAKEYDEKYKLWNLDNFPFIPENFEIKIREETKNHFYLVKKLINDSKTEYIINATDSDREGELIFAYIYELANCKKPFKRVLFNSQTDEDITKAFHNILDSKDVELPTKAAKCRAIADWLVGNNFTVLATLKYGGYKNLISLGRVQTPTLAILVNRELEIKNFKQQKYYELEGAFSTKNNEFYKGKLKNKFSTKQEVENLIEQIKNKQAVVEEYEGKESLETPPLLYDLTSLQMDANKTYGFSPKETLSIVQKLYENQILTYPRTNSRYLKDDMKNEIKRLLENLQGTYQKFTQQILSKPLNYSKRVFDNSKIESHTAIITTYKTPTSLNDNEQKIYDLVAKSLLKAFMPNAKWFNVTVKTKVSNEVFYSTGKTLIEPGWRIIEKQSSNNSNNVMLIPKLEKDEIVFINKLDNLEKITKPPSRITDGKLLGYMEGAGKLIDDEVLRESIKEHGIGTSATRADIIEKLINVKYVERKGKNLIPTQKGIEVIQSIPIEEIKSPEMTGEWEYNLSQIAKGKTDSNQFLNNIKQYVMDISNKLKTQEKHEIASNKELESLGICPVCGKPVIKNKKGWGCSDWKNGCKFQIWDNEICGKHLTDSNIKQLLDKKITRTIKNFTSKKGKNFDAKLELVLEKEKYIVKFNFSK